MKQLNFDQMLELRNQEFLMSMKKIPDITKELKDRLIRNISTLLDHTDVPAEEFRIKQVKSKLELIETKEVQKNFGTPLKNEEIQQLRNKAKKYHKKGGKYLGSQEAKG